MGYQPLEKLLPKAKYSIYKLVLLAAKRATELAEGMPSLISRPSNIKTTTLALDEIMEGKVVLKGAEDQLVPGDLPKIEEEDEKSEEMGAEKEE
ncbi:MAG: DNA-directed RNA polymerase subunit omega [Candidatus Omnitrophica bacterium]|nr:DNA-directed RNA polymerase subunit omega [Candidatus Omnitrophota bacterium]